MMSQFGVNFKDVAGGLLVSMLLYQSCVIFYRLFLSRLAKFPGPKLAAASSWYEAFFDLHNADFPDVLQRLHDKYGESRSAGVCGLYELMCCKVPSFVSILSSFQSEIQSFTTAYTFPLRSEGRH